MKQEVAPFRRDSNVKPKNTTGTIWDAFLGTRRAWGAFLGAPFGHHVRCFVFLLEQKTKNRGRLLQKTSADRSDATEAHKLLEDGTQSAQKDAPKHLVFLLSSSLFFLFFSLSVPFSFFLFFFLFPFLFPSFLFPSSPFFFLPPPHP
jgi:hypothetical protein